MKFYGQERSDIVVVSAVLASFNALTSAPARMMPSVMSSGDSSKSKISAFLVRVNENHR